MNAHFKGTPFVLAERYTNMTKTFFLCLIFSNIFPASYFLCSISLLITYFFDKYSLFRTWSSHVQYGTKLAKASRHFYVICIVAHAIMTTYWWTGFPFDNVCEKQESFFYCNQNIVKSKDLFLTYNGDLGRFFWMSSNQTKLALFCLWTSVVMLFGGILLTYVYITYVKLRHFFHRSHEVRTQDQMVDLTSLMEYQDVPCYVPQLKDHALPHPLIACNIDNIDKSFVECAGEDYDENNIIFDVQELNHTGRKRGESIEIGENSEYDAQVFSTIKGWNIET